MFEEFLAASRTSIRTATIGDFGRATPLQPGDIPRDLGKYRTFDLRASWPAIKSAASEAFTRSEILRQTTTGLDFVMDDATELPLLVPPRIGIHGFYWLREDQGLLVLPGAFLKNEISEKGDTARVLQVEGNRREGYILIPSGHIIADGKKWQVNCTTVPTREKDREEALRMGPAAWWEKLKATPLIAYPDKEFSGLVGTVLVMEMGVLLANSIALADPSVVRVRDVPVKRRRSLEKKGRAVPRGRVWLDLPGLRYAKGSFTAPREGGVAWHMVRGHYRTLSSERYTRMAGTEVWVRPHSRGKGDAGGGSGYRLRRDAIDNQT